MANGLELTEKAMEDILAVHAEMLLGERGLHLIQRQLTVGSYRFDLLFRDRFGTHLIVEIQRGTLDREHMHKILDYYYEYKERKPQEYVDLMVVANNVTSERKQRLKDLGIAYREITVAEFIRFKESPSHDQSVTSIPLPQEGSAAAVGPDEPTIGTLRRLFLEQTEQFRDRVVADDPDARFRMARSLPDDGKNWFITFYPGAWGYPSSGAGVHWELYSTQRSKRPSGLLLLNVGVEVPLDPEYKNNFMQKVRLGVRSGSPLPLGFTLFGEGSGQSKLLVAPPLALDESAAAEAHSLYRQVAQFNALVADRIREFDAANHFLSPLRYT